MKSPNQVVDLITQLEDNEFESLVPYPKSIQGIASQLTEEEKISGIANHFAKIMELLGLDLNDESLQKTPKRVAKMFVKEVFSGLNPSTFPEVNCMENKYAVPGNGMIFTGDIQLCSFCEHHFVPMVGKAYVAYYPKDKIIGLSKVNRIVLFYARRPQIQERLTAQVAETLQKVLHTHDVAVGIKLKHFCVLARGIRDHTSWTSTYAFHGKFEKDPYARREFLKNMTLKES